MKETSLSVRISKTVQERQYEPFTVEMIMTVTPEDGLAFSTKELKTVYERLESRVDSAINARMGKAAQDPLYGG